MKRSINLLASLVCVSFAICAFATTYNGAGTWQSSNGTSGEYTVGAQIEMVDEDNLNINQTLNFGNETLNINVVIHKTDDTFFDVINADTNEVIGAGYCFPFGDAQDSKICHSDSVAGDEFIESTIKLTPRAIFRMGSKTNLSNGDKTVWKDTLHPSVQE